MQFSDSFKEGTWDGSTVLCRKRSFDHGHLDRVTSALDKKGFTYTVLGDINYPVDHLVLSEPFLANVRGYQREAIKVWMSKRQGIIKIPTRTGKTFLAAECMRFLIQEQPNIKICFLTDNSSIFVQNKKEVEKIIKEEAGTIQGSTIDIRRVTFAMAQSIDSKIKRRKTYTNKQVENRIRMKQALSQFDAVIVDECHLFMESRRTAVIKAFTSARCTLGLSATPYKKSNILGSARIVGVLGPIIKEVGEAKLRKSGILAKDKIIFIKTPAARYGAYWPETYEENVVENKVRNKYIEDIVSICRRNDLKVIIFVEKKAHGLFLAEMLGEPFVYGESPQDIRESTKSEFLKKKGGCMISSRVFSIGVSFPTVNVLINAAAGKESTAAQQRRGRVLGTTKDKTKSMTIDFYDLDGRNLEKHAESRIEAYKEQSEDLKVRKVDLSKEGNLEKFEKHIVKWFS